MAVLLRATPRVQCTPYTPSDFVDVAAASLRDCQQPADIANRPSTTAVLTTNGQGQHLAVDRGGSRNLRFPLSPPVASPLPFPRLPSPLLPYLFVSLPCPPPSLLEVGFPLNQLEGLGERCKL